jgi:ribonuclease P protein component
MRLSRDGKKFHSRHFLVLYAPASENRSRVGITVTRRVGAAVQRNHIRRLVRENYRHMRHMIAGNWDINIIVKKEAAHLTFAELGASLAQIFKDINRRDDDLPEYC